MPVPCSLAYSYIRMSTELQLKGDSRRRQLEKSEKYAANHELELADDARLEDIGISAFKGANVRDGALGKFLEAAKAGKIAPGSFLLVESLDRLTRQDINKSLALFLLIINAGINIVTLGDERVYRAEKLDLPDFITSLVIMSRAHEESMIKSQRVSAAWASKRSQARNRPVTAMCPAWLVLSEDRTQYKTIPERAKVVRAIFDDTVAGIGNYTIKRGSLSVRFAPIANRIAAQQRMSLWAKLGNERGRKLRRPQSLSLFFFLLYRLGPAISGC